MTITQVKQELSVAHNTLISSIRLQQQEDKLPGTEEVVLAPWWHYWHKQPRLRVSMHQEVYDKLKADPTRIDLDYKREDVPDTATKQGYIRYFIFVGEGSYF